ncbi:MAG: hypothetical protein GOU98_04475 [Candidatus Altiarchaeota archaeon]|nr:hypothetical protein [Candidatus Altiarchaeota archaeon]
MVAVETVLTIILGFFLLMWLSIRVRKGGRWFREKGLFGMSLLLVISGVLLLLAAYLSSQIAFLSFLQAESNLYIKLGTALLVAGAVGIILDQLYMTWKKEQLLGVEKERRTYIERTRFGLSVDEAEKIAKNHIKKVTNKNTKLVASKKEFKHWAIYLKDSDQKYYRVVINGDGKIEEWETMDEIPSYILSP